MSLKSYAAFTLIETVVSMAVLLILFTVSVPIFKNFDKKSDLEQGKEIIVSALRSAQKRTMASRFQGKWGTYIATSTTPAAAIIFFGSDYATRDASHDETNLLPATVRIASIEPYELRETVFERLSGAASSSATIIIELISDPSKRISIYLDSSGQISTFAFTPPSTENRNLDTRHLHFEFSGNIATSSDYIFLDFEDGTLVHSIPIASNLAMDQISWQDDIIVGGETQSIGIKTMRLQSPDTEFCVFRDRRANNKKLEIGVGATLGSAANLIEYSADGLSAATGTSILVSGPIWQ